jgi:ABC-type transport system involved in multi-copper enzyme maturation permease subunit
MSEILHILRKDLRRLRWGLLLWTLVIVARLLVATSGAAFAFGDFGLQLAIEEISMLVATIDALLLALLVSWLVHDEPLVGADAFWLTRPIDRSRLLAAKMIFAALLLVGVPAVGQAMTAAAIGGGWHDALRTAPRAAFGQALWVLPLLALAVLTPTIMRFLVVIVASVAAVVVAVSTMTTFLLMTRSDDMMDFRPSQIPDQTAGVVLMWLLAASAMAVIVYQYRNRRVGRAIVIGAIGIGAAVLISSVWPWHFAKAAEPDPGAWARDTLTAAVVDGVTPPHVSDIEGLSERARASKFVAVPMRITNLPPDVSVDAFSVRAQLAIPSGTVLQSAQSRTITVRHAATQSALDRTSRLQAALGDALLVSSRVIDFDQWPVVLRVNDHDYARYANVPGRLTADVDAFVYRSRVAGSLPLVDGTAIEIGSTRFKLLRTLRRSDGCTVLVRQSVAASSEKPSAPRTYELVLLNRARKEAVAGSSQYVPGISGRLAMGTVFEGAGSGFFFAHLIDRFPVDAPIESKPVLDASWIDHAELAIVETTYAGRVSRSISIDDFRMAR